MNIIALEGIDGCGKTTMILLIKNWLEEQGYSVETVIEPQNELIREILYENGDNGWAGAALFAADRMITFKNINHDCDFVLMDRSILSTIVYQMAQGVPIDYIFAVNDRNTILVPDLFIYIFKPIPERDPDFIESDKMEDIIENYSYMAASVEDIETVTFYDGQPMRTFDEIKKVIENKFFQK